MTRNEMTAKLVEAYARKIFNMETAERENSFINGEYEAVYENETLTREKLSKMVFGNLRYEINQNHYIRLNGGIMLEGKHIRFLSWPKAQEIIAEAVNRLWKANSSDWDFPHEA